WVAPAAAARTGQPEAPAAQPREGRGEERVASELLRWCRNGGKVGPFVRGVSVTPAPRLSTSPDVAGVLAHHRRVGAALPGLRELGHVLQHAIDPVLAGRVRVG